MNVDYNEAYMILLDKNRKGDSAIEVKHPLINISKGQRVRRKRSMKISRKISRIWSLAGKGTVKVVPVPFSKLSFTP
jgi:hypothetical protein